MPSHCNSITTVQQYMESGRAPRPTKDQRASFPSTNKRRDIFSSSLNTRIANRPQKVNPLCNELPFQLFHQINTQSNCAYAHRIRERLSTWPSLWWIMLRWWSGETSCQVLSSCTFFPTSWRWHQPILFKTSSQRHVLKAINRRHINVSVLKQHWLKSRSEGTYAWQRSCAQGTPDLNPNKSLWSILKDKVTELDPGTTLGVVIQKVTTAWATIDHSVLND